MDFNDHYLKKELYRLVKEDVSIFDFIQQGALDGIWYWDLENPENEWMSARFWTTLGYDPGIKKHLAEEWQDIIFKQDLEQAIHNFTRHCEDPEHPYDQIVRYRHRDGSTVWIRCRGIAIRDYTGKPVRMLGAHTDLTKQKKAEQALKNAKNSLALRIEQRTRELAEANQQLKQELEARTKAEQALRESESRYRSMMNAMKDPAYISSPDFRVEYMNPAMESIVGRNALGERCHKALHDLDEKCPWCVQDNISGKVHADIEIISPKNGHAYLVSRFPLVREGKSASTMAVHRDMTDLKLLEGQLRQAQKMEAIGTLAGGVAHDFNNILTAIIGNADLMLMDDDIPSHVKEGIEEIKMSGERAAELTRQLLAFSRKQVIQPKAIDFNELLSKLHKMLIRLIGEDIDIRIVESKGLWLLKMDRIQLEQVVINLVVNGRDAMPDGGKLTIETANATFDDAYLHQHGIKGETGPYVMLAVSDTGTGIDKETQEHIFEPFFTTKEHGKGTGLGLSSIYGIVKQNRGFIWVYSEPGQGTTFKIYLPKNTDSGSGIQAEPHQITVKETRGCETILVVEDDERLRKVVRTILGQFGYTVLEKENGLEAIDFVSTYTGAIDLVIADVVMPKMNGRQAADRIKSLCPGIKVLFMSGYTDNAIVHHGVLKDGLNFIEKPFSPGSLLQKIRYILDSDPAG